MEEKKTNTKPRIWLAGLICAALMTVVCGIVYPLAMTGLAQLTMPRQANGSLIIVEENGRQVCYGSELVAQTFTEPQYLIGRPDSGSPSNLSAVSEEQRALVEERVAWWHALDPENTADIPMELVTASGSGVDPHISPRGRRIPGAAHRAGARDQRGRSARRDCEAYGGKDLGVHGGRPRERPARKPRP